jgi:hypothetical protein
MLRLLLRLLLAERSLGKARVTTTLVIWRQRLLLCWRRSRRTALGLLQQRDQIQPLLVIAMRITCTRCGDVTMPAARTGTAAVRGRAEGGCVARAGKTGATRSSGRHVSASKTDGLSLLDRWWYMRLPLCCSCPLLSPLLENSEKPKKNGWVDCDRTAPAVTHSIDCAGA